MGKWTRRAVITTGTLTGGALLLGVAIRPGNRSAKVAPLIANEDETVLNVWLKIAADNTVTAVVPHAEMGQGVHTTLAMMLAEELDANWSDVRMMEAPSKKEYANYALAKGFAAGDADIPAFLVGTVDGVFLTATKDDEPADYRRQYVGGDDRHGGNARCRCGRKGRPAAGGRRRMGCARCRAGRC